MDNYILKQSQTEAFDATSLSERNFLPGDTIFHLLGWNVWPGKYFETSQAEIRLSALPDGLREEYLDFAKKLVAQTSLKCYT